ncbi:MAG: UDP-N-acetylmuramoyl-L-alanine--D-glutamate ligase [Acidimicrobiales bacterium]
MGVLGSTGGPAGRALVVGLGVAGEAVARHLADRGWSVTVSEDRPTHDTRARAAALGGRGVVTVDAPGPERLASLVEEATLVVPSPGVPATHPGVSRALAAGRRVWSELELAARWSSVPVVAVTGTNGKTTVTTLIRDMLAASGLRTVAASNNELPLVDAGEDHDVIVVEASSFRLRFTETFQPVVGVWINLAPDHLDWHGTMEAYAAAKARIWAAQGPEQVAVANAEDPVVMAWASSAPARVVTFGHDHGDWRVRDGRLRGPDGDLAETSALWRSLPHDRTNALAAAAAASIAGASLSGVVGTLRSFRGLPHRVSLVAEVDGVRYYDDSKATDPHATAAAVAGFPSVVLIAGGRNKGLDLSALAADTSRIRTVVAIGEAAPEVERAFAGRAPVTCAGSMDEAVARARTAARRGDAVLLSPGCASFDWYRSYRERGADFARAVTGSGGRS